MSDAWLPSLIADDPEAGFALAVKLSRMAVKLTQPDGSIREGLRPKYEADANASIAVSGVVATYFATISAANNYWKDTS